MLVNLFGSMALAIWIFHFCLWYQYAGTRTRRSDVASGRLYPLNTRGSVVYLNKRENSNLIALTVLTVDLFGIAVLANGIFVDESLERTMPCQKKRFRTESVAE